VNVFEAVVGVDEAISGYAGGTTKILRMNKLVLILVMPLPYTMTQSYFFQGISECVFRVTRPDNSQSTRARSWFFLSLYCLYKNAAEKKIIEDKLRAYS
jgi:peptide-methionine (S)-S-oxide reductase